MTTDNNTNPVVKESLTTQKGEMKQVSRWSLDSSDGNMWPDQEHGDYVDWHNFERLQSERDQLKKLNDCLQEGVDAFKELYLKDKDERDRLKNENHALHQSEYNHLENIKQLKRALYEQQVYTAELQAKERELYNKYDAQFTELTTANKVIDQCEEALISANKYMHKSDCQNTETWNLLEDAERAIQSLKLKGK